MIKIIGVRFRNAGKIYYFDPKDYVIKSGEHVIVETARGVEYGTVLGGVREVTDDKVIQPLKPVLRVANAEDDAKATYNREREKEAMSICKEKIRKHNLDMKLIDAEYTFDNNKVLFYFTADGRIDFRELVKDLAAVFRTRIELRQIGVRDETKILGGIGICGRPLCCNTFLSDFVPVSIKMAKEQNLSLNPTKISGVCGRLMCCLKNEEETYEYLNSKLPGIGDAVMTETGLRGEVSGVSVLRQKVKVLVDVDGEKEIQEYDVDELKFRPRKRREKGDNKDHRENHTAESTEELQMPGGAEGNQTTLEAGGNETVGAVGQELPDAPEAGMEAAGRELRGDRRQERSDRRGEKRGEGRSDRREDKRWESRNDRRRENRAENEAGGEGREAGGEQHSERRSDERGDRRRENRNNRRRENRSEEGADRRRENRGEEGTDRRRENRGEEGTDRRRENRSEEGTDRRRENRGERTRNDRHGENRSNRNNRGFRGGDRPREKYQKQEFQKEESGEE